MSSLPPPPPPGSGPPPPPTGWNAPAPTPPPAYSGGYGAGWQDQSFRYAGFWSRVGARLLDGLIGAGVMLPFAIGGIICLAKGLDCYEVPYKLGDRGIGYHCDGVKNSGLAAAGFAILIAGALLWLTLFIRWWARGQTPGMKAAGNRLVRVGTLEPIGTGRAVARFFASLLSGWFLYLGYFWMIWDKQKRTWHDMMCETIVIKA